MGQIIKFFLAKFFDKLKVKNPAIYAIIGLFAILAEAIFNMPQLAEFLTPLIGAEATANVLKWAPEVATATAVIVNVRTTKTVTEGEEKRAARRAAREARKAQKDEQKPAQ